MGKKDKRNPRSSIVFRFNLPATKPANPVKHALDERQNLPRIQKDKKRYSRKKMPDPGRDPDPA